MFPVQGGMNENRSILIDYRNRQIPRNRLICTIFAPGIRKLSPSY